MGVHIIEAATRTSFDAGNGHYVVGDYEECRNILRRWIEAGAMQICAWPVVSAVEQIQRFGEYVLPGL